jgi:hypothetical protein
VKLAVEIAAVVVALASAAVSWYFAWRAEQRAGRAEAAAKSAEEREERAERRDEERLEREREAAERSRLADLVVNLEGSSHRPFGIRELKFHIRNVGEAIARDVRFQLIDGDDNVVSSPGRAFDVLTLAAGERTSDPIIRQVEYASDLKGNIALPPGLTSHVIWIDDSGHQERREPVIASIDDVA